MLSVGDVAPPLSVKPVFGLHFDLAERLQSYPVALVFVRYLDDVAARESLAAVQNYYRDFDLHGVHVLAITRSSLDTAWDFVPRYHVLYPVYCDPDGTLFEGNGVAPDVAVKTQATDLIGRTDTVLDKALELLR